MLRSVLVVIILLGGASAALSQHAGTPQEQQACTRDASRFCRNVLGNDWAVQQCLQQHRAALSRACSRVFASRGM
jgi:hypothetical protein